MKPKAIVSACLLGQYCRYDAKTKQVDEVIKALEDYEIIPFCPEAPLFGTPRQRIDVVRVGSEERIITHDTKEDLTELLACEVQNFIEKHLHAKTIILKSKSPSCGLGTTPILDQEGELIKYGDGLAATLFKQHYQSVFCDETMFLP